MAAKGSVKYINPASMVKNPAFTQAISITGPAKTIYIGAQTSVTGDRVIVGKDDIGAQTEQILKNIDACLEAAGAQREHLIMWTIYLKQGQPIQPGVEAFQRWWGNRPNPPANTVIFVAELVPPDFLVMIDAIAVVPGG